VVVFELLVNIHSSLSSYLFSENDTTQSLPSNGHNRKAAREARDSLTGRLYN